MGIRIGIDALFIIPGEVGGTASYLLNLLKGLEKIDDENEYFIFICKSEIQVFNIYKHNFNFIICDLDNRSRVNRVIYTSITLPRLINKYKINVMFFPTYVRCIQNLSETKIISNVHDIQYRHYPEYFSLNKKILLSIMYPISFYKSNINICISNFVKNDIMKHYKINPDNFKVIYNPIDFDKYNINIDKHHFNSIKIKYGIEEKKYILSVASLLPHKNLLTLIKAYIIYMQNNKDSSVKLVLVGTKGKSINDILKLITKQDIKDNVIIPGFISDDELDLLYNDAAIFVNTSLYEGFGMPPVEAMYKNIPVITTRCGSLPEVTLGEAIYYNNPTDAEELANTIQETLDHGFQYRKDIKDILYERYCLENIAKKYKKLFEDN